MMVRTIAEISTPKGVIPIGQIIDVPPCVPELKDKVVPLTDGREKLTYCPVCDCWCSCRIPEFAHECKNCGGAA